MKLSLFLKLLAAYLGLLGAAALLLPQTATGQLGQPMAPFDVFASRTVGVVLLTVAVLDWVLSSAGRPVPRGALLANLLMNTALGVIDTFAIAGRTIGASSSVGIAFHAVFTICLCFYLFRTSPAAITSPRTRPAR